MRLFYGWIQILIIWQACVLYTQTQYNIYIYETIIVQRTGAFSTAICFHIAQRENLSSFIAELHLIWPKICSVKQ